MRAVLALSVLAAPSFVMAQNAVDLDAFVAAQEQAAAAAIRPGDAALSCDLLYAEVVALGTDPAIQTYAAQSAAAMPAMVAVAGDISGTVPEATPVVAPTVPTVLPGAIGEPAAAVADEAGEQGGRRR